MRKLKLIPIIIIINLILLFFFFGSNTTYKSHNYFSYESIEEGENLQISGYFNLTGTPIRIASSDDWYDASLNDWCNGSGTSIDPYVIENVIIDGLNAGSPIEIKNTNDFFEIRNCILSNSGTGGIRAGIVLDHADNGLLINNTIDNCIIGIDTSFSNNINITDNRLCENPYGIKCSHSVDFRIINNTINNSSNGIYIYDISLIIFKENKMNNCGITIRAVNLSEYNSISLDTTNLVNNKSVYYYKNKKALTSYNFSNPGQLLLINCNDSLISNLELSRGGIGISLYESHNNTIFNNTIFENNHRGIELCSSNENRILNNTISNTRGDPYFSSATGGLFLFQSSQNNNITGNILYNNSDIGIEISSSSSNGNLLYFNNFSLNLNQAKDVSNSAWFRDSIGNFWSDYGGVDANDDGIGDSSYNFIDEKQDLYPIWWDSPILSLNSPSLDEMFETNPSFEITIDEGVADMTWYSIDNGLTNITFTGLTGDINSTEWYSKPNGLIHLIFYVNDSKGYMDQVSVNITKVRDTPMIEIISPTSNQEFGTQPPEFTITITDTSSIVAMWYTIDSGINNFSFSELTDIINSTIWASAPEGNITLTIYVEDELGIIGSESRIIIKDLSEKLGDNGLDIPGYNMIILIGAIAIISLIFLKRQK